MGDASLNRIPLPILFYPQDSCHLRQVASAITSNKTTRLVAGAYSPKRMDPLQHRGQNDGATIVKTRTKWGMLMDHFQGVQSGRMK